MDLNEIPKSDSEISAEWLTEALTLENDQHVSEVIVKNYQRVLVLWVKWRV